MFITWGLFGLFVASLLSATVIPLASEGILLYFLIQKFDPLLCFVIATSGNCIGGFITYWMGTKVSNWAQLKTTRWIKAPLIRKYGAWLAWGSWIPFIGDPILLGLGFYRTHKTTTFLFMILGKALRYAVIVLSFNMA